MPRADASAGIREFRLQPGRAPASRIPPAFPAGEKRTLILMLKTYPSHRGSVNFTLAIFLLTSEERQT